MRDVLNLGCGRKLMDAAVNLDVSPDVVGAMEEIHRVCRSGARVHMTVPHFSAATAYIDPTHRHQFGCFSFDYFASGHELAFYSRARFKRHRAQIVFYPTLVNGYFPHGSCRSSSKW